MAPGTSKISAPEPLIGPLAEIKLNLPLSPVVRTNHKPYKIACTVLRSALYPRDNSIDPSSHEIIRNLLFDTNLPLDYVQHILEAYNKLWRDVGPEDMTEDQEVEKTTIPSEQTFPLFSKLLPEIRLKIWELAIPGHFIIPSVVGHNFRGWEYSVAGSLPRIAQTCTEALQAATTKKFEWTEIGLPYFEKRRRTESYSWIYPRDCAILYPMSCLSRGGLMDNPQTPDFSTGLDNSMEFLKNRDLVYFRADQFDELEHRALSQELVECMKALKRISVLSTYVCMHYRFEGFGRPWPFEYPYQSMHLGDWASLDNVVHFKKMLLAAHPGTCDADLELVRLRLVKEWEDQYMIIRKSWVKYHVKNVLNMEWDHVFPGKSFDEDHAVAREALLSLPPMEQSMVFVWYLHL